jgi:hypothetical protein
MGITRLVRWRGVRGSVGLHFDPSSVPGASPPARACTYYFDKMVIRSHPVSVFTGRSFVDQVMGFGWFSAPPLLITVGL